MIVAIQFYSGDAHKAIALVRFLADIETVHRNDMLLGLVCQPGTDTKEAEQAVDYCSNKMPTELVISNRPPQDSKGCADLWAATVEYFANNPRGHTSICTFDGGDSVPLRKNWFNDLNGDHALTIDQGKTITGFFQGANFVNANLILELSVWRDCPDFRKRMSLPLNYWIWEPQFCDILVPRTRPSTTIYSEPYSYGISVDWLRGRSNNSAWSHGWKDEDLIDKARRLILG